MDGIGAVRERYRQLWQLLRPGEAPHELSVVPQGDGRHVELKDGEYRYIMSERGAYLDVQTTRDPDELAYWIAINMTQPLLTGENDHRKWLRRQADQLGRIDPAWRERRLREAREILGPDKIAAVHETKGKR